MPAPQLLGEPSPALLHPERHNLLVVDDDLALRMMSRLALTKAGFGVTEASDGFTALSWLDSHRFDAILLDARMPGMDGFSVCKQMRHQLGDDAVPIIMVTGQDDDESIDAAFESGATDFAAKPLNWRIITQRLNSLIRASAIKKHLNNRSLQMSSMLKTSSEAMLLLDRFGVIQGTHLIERLPPRFADRMVVGHRLLDCLPEGCVDVVRTSLLVAQEAGRGEDFVVHQQHDLERYALRGRIVVGAEDELLCLLQDQDQSSVGERQLFELTYTDPDTGIANEKQLISELGQGLRAGVENGTHTVLLRFSLSGLQGVEPRVGRPGMVKLAQIIVERLELGVDSFLARCQDRQPAYLVARLSETDYVLVLSELHDPGFAEDLATVLLRRLATNVEIDGHACAVDWRVGIADTVDASATVDGLLSATAYALQADTAPAGASVAGYPVHRFDAHLKRRVSQDIELERLLRRDIADGLLEVHYQPKLDLSGLTLIGMEALIRWTSRELGQVSPATFIPIAEKTGLIVPLSHLVVERVFDQLVAWREAGRRPVPISINVSGIHLNSRTILEELKAGIQQRGIPPELVELEVTESIMIEGGGKAIKNLVELRHLGFRVAIDDFGTGYSSLSYLRDLPVDCLKIDRSFVQAITSDPTAEAIARAIITVGHDVGLHVLAEGVETEEQLNRLAGLGCDSVQGYFTGRPVPSQAFTPLLERLHLLG